MGRLSMVEGHREGVTEDVEAEEDSEGEQQGPLQPVPEGDEEEDGDDDEEGDRKIHVNANADGDLEEARKRELLELISTCFLSAAPGSPNNENKENSGGNVAAPVPQPGEAELTNGAAQPPDSLRVLSPSPPAADDSLSSLPAESPLPLEDLVELDSCLPRAAFSGREDVLRGIFQLRPAEMMTFRDGVGRSCLHYAVSGGSVACVDFIADHLPDLVNVADKAGWTALHIATVAKRVDIMKTLLVRGADANAPLRHHCAPHRGPPKESQSIHFAAIRRSYKANDHSSSNGRWVERRRERSEVEG
eukprot:GHVU01215900.1.p2 GENE.GHVU01215900.1~~GHVU01215900.1.p2  ORF type:complete len:304 (+),score=64.49 GHVU01215900.1:305-1216(+)